MNNLAPMRDIHAYLAAQEGKSLLRFITCGSVDDGKSTLIGRLLYDAKSIFEDQLTALAKDSRKHGTNGADIDLALLVDGLEAEREQGITIDVAYRFFATEKRKFIVADTPGHEQYTRNMATGASTAQLAVLLADARSGLLTQTRRHAFIANLLGVKHIVLAVNKIDLVNFNAARFGEISAAFQELAAHFSFSTAIAIPISARYGDNVSRHSEQMAWYSGPTLIEHLETVAVEEDEAAKPFRMPVQWVNRPHLNFRGYSGTVAEGTVRAGDKIAIPSSGRTSAVKAIVASDGELAEAFAGDAVTLTLDDEIDISRGDILVSAEDRPEYSDQLAAHIIWMSETPLLPGRPYLLRMNGKTVTASVTSLKCKIDINNNYEKLAAKDLVLNEIGVCNLALSAAVAFDPYAASRKMGSFILIDRQTNATVAAGMVQFGLRRATNIHQHSMDVDKAARAALNGQKPAILWFTGLSGSGKSTIANLLEKELFARGCRTYLLDGDNVRHGLNRDLGFTDTDRVENIRRVGEVAKLFVDAGLIVLTSFISPFRAERRMARELVGDGEFLEVFVDTPLEVCRQRDPKGLYRKADEGKIPNFTGVDSPYEIPEAPELRLPAADREPERLVQLVLGELTKRGIVHG